ncbi:hypothetical protein OROGR_013321 [Orobanche gracilis]
MGRKRKFRLWWPSNLFSQTSPVSSFLFGWFIPSSEDSFDVMVAFACDEPKLTSSVGPGLDLQEIIERTNNNMPAFLQEKSQFWLLGHCEADASCNGELVKCGNDVYNYINSTSDRHVNTCTSDHVEWNCGCSKHEGIFEQVRIAALESIWIRLLYGHFGTNNRRVLVIPKLDHLHLNSEIVSHLDLHVILYEVPTFGGHHYSMCIDSPLNLVPSTYKKPKWFEDRHQKNTHLVMDTVIQAMNSANAAQMFFDGHHHAKSGFQFLIVRKISTFTWKLFAVCDQRTRDWLCVGFAEKATFHKHSMWSNVMVDILLGNTFGIPLWFMAEPACLSVSNFAHDFTNDWLRTGCVWLMGNPAGFKLNTELAGVLGMICLNAIQIWSTLWIFMGFFFVYLTKGLALCGIIFGLTSAAALIVDVISLATMHVLTLHFFLSLIYSTQIQALAALWRLFRGKKGNPLRHRLDSYDYTVEQQVVVSLLFTPILLLLPTTSAFYIFFTILYTFVSFVCIVLENAISFIHSTPYAKLFIWLKRRARFPCGIWLELRLCQRSETGAVSGSNVFHGELQKTAYASSNCESTILVSFLHSNYLNLGEIVSPHYRFFYSSFSRSSIGSAAHGLITGRRLQHFMRSCAAYEIAMDSNPVERILASLP